MDIYCPKCGDPVEVDYLHDVADEQERTFSAVRVDFTNRGCAALGSTCNPDVNEMRAMASAALMELSGDDLDGVASELEDFEWLGMLS